MVKQFYGCLCSKSFCLPDKKNAKWFFVSFWQGVDGGGVKTTFFVLDLDAYLTVGGGVEYDVGLGHSYFLFVFYSI